MNYLAPSLLAADFAHLGDAVETIDQAGAQYVHIDVMDGLFVPSISFGMPVIKSIRPLTDRIFDVHLMIEDPDRYIDEFVACGADLICVHVETTKHLDRTIAHIRETGAKVGIALNPATSLSAIEWVLPLVDMVLIMSVNPGFGGQRYIPYCTDKICKLRSMINEFGLQVDIEVDGGINPSNIEEIVEAGANILVAGSAVFKGDVATNVQELLGKIQVGK